MYYAVKNIPSMDAMGKHSWSPCAKTWFWWIFLVIFVRQIVFSLPVSTFLDASTSVIWKAGNKNPSNVAGAFDCGKMFWDSPDFSRDLGKIMEWLLKAARCLCFLLVVASYCNLQQNCQREPEIYPEPPKKRKEHHVMPCLKKFSSWLLQSSQQWIVVKP